eukprot:CAMPEP_0113897130 /NCGR_PEP_ID=MMETSP0780_2-20120614/18477_1 /TAXON_ID=652834 /ORGANISM="Palpitomonas bilix" /LENGTH=304 /DNA_ID=CAMNT_0000888497 /DNA_START=155 /DNA_END=1069 /DNA_ORIENTATION=+ /assembly_acc=CAM_ASM_000599
MSSYDDTPCSPFLGTFSGEELGIGEISEFYSVDGRVDVPDMRPFVWSNSVISLDGKLGFLEAGSMDSKAVALNHIPNSCAKADWKLLNAGWAIADAVVGTGAILRAEPDIKFVPSMFPDLIEWRKTLNRREPLPASVIVSGSGNIDPNHTLFADTSYRTVVYTTRRGKERIEKSAEEQGGAHLLSNAQCEVRVCEAEGDPSSVGWKAMMKELRVKDGVRYLDVSAGGVVIAELIQEKVLDEVRATVAGHFMGGAATSGVERPNIFTPARGKAFTHENNPVLRYDGMRALGRYLLFLRATVEYRH